MKQIELKNCPICGEDNLALKVESVDFSVTKESFKIDECLTCGFLFTNPRPAADDLGRYYESSAYVSHTNQSDGLFGKTYQALRKWSIRRKTQLIDQYAKKGSVLDYGCGTGEFLAECKRQEWIVQGIELNEEVRKRAAKTHKINVASPAELHAFSNASYNVITMWHVLEHVSDLKEACSEIVKKLELGGILIVAVPNPQSWDAKYYKQYWAAWDLPIHLYHFNRNNIEGLFGPMGMELLTIKKMPLDSFYVSLLSEEYLTGKKKWLKASLIGLLSNIRAIRTNNSSSLTYVLKKIKA